jgi:tetratricopeptide (TPR) repeat protein
MLRWACLLFCLLAGAWAVAQEPELTPRNGTAPPNQAPPRSDRANSEESSSKDAKVDLSPPRDDAKNHPNSTSSDEDEPPSDVQEFHPWDPHKAAKDIEVGDFYLKRKNYFAAEGRYRDALLWKPNDAVATYRLGETAEKQGKLDEAREQYESYLKILPNGPLAQDAHKAIERLKKLESKNTGLKQ